MEVEPLVKMANDVAAFFHGGASADEAAPAIATHLRNYWEPRMRRQIILHLRSGGAGLSALARAGVELLAAEAQPPA
jgi:formate dehydrogenase subunit delta